MNLVTIENGKPVTDSLTVAEAFGKEHARVLRDIRELECSEQFRVGNFAESTYVNGQGRPMPKAIISEQGFTLLAMGYTGSVAMEFKERYISEFGRMREQLNKPPVLDSNTAVALALQQTSQMMLKVPQIESKLEELDNKVETQITLDHGEQRRIQKAISTKVYGISEDSERRSELFRELHREIKDRWGVPSYKDVLRKDMQSLIKYIDAWQPRRVTAC